MEQINLYERVSPLLPGENAFPERQVCDKLDYISIINLTVYCDSRKLFHCIFIVFLIPKHVCMKRLQSLNNANNLKGVPVELKYPTVSELPVHVVLQ